jgi:hypothetical protein
MKNRLLFCLAAVLVAGIAACDDDPTTPVSKIVTFEATLTPGAEVPAPTGNTANATGTFVGVLDTSTNVFTYDVTFSGLTSGVNNGHIHGPADPGVATGALLNFNTLPGAQFSFGATSGTGHGTVLLTAATTITQSVNGDSLRKLLFAGKTYANIHTTTNSPGEIRGEIRIRP